MNCTIKQDFRDRYIVKKWRAVNSLASLLVCSHDELYSYIHMLNCRDHL